MGGLNATDRLRLKGGIDAKKATETLIAVDDIYIPRTGLLAHPRAGDPLDREMLEDIKANGVKNAVLIRRDGMYPIEGKKRGEKMRLTLIDGCRRTEHLIEAVRILRAEGALRDGQRYIPAEFFVGDDKAALFERLRRNTDPLKKPDAPSVLAKTATQLHRAKAEPVEILAAMPRQITASILECLLRWGDLVSEAAVRFDGGAPLGLMGAVLAAPREEQVARLDAFLKAGLTDTRGATRRLNKERKANGAAPFKLRPRKVFTRIESHLTGERRALVAFLRGDDHALDGFPDALAELTASGWDREKGSFLRKKGT